MKKALNIISTILVSLVVILAIALAGVRLFGLQTYVVLSGSMEPTFKTGSVVYVKHADASEIESGDIITFSIDGDMVATHRVVEVVREGSTTSFRTKGDANNMVDGRLVTEDRLVGKALVSIPGLGYLVEFIHTDIGRFVAICVGVILVLLVVLPGYLSPDEKRSQQQ